LDIEATRFAVFQLALEDPVEAEAVFEFADSGLARIHMQPASGPGNDGDDHNGAYFSTMPNPEDEKRLMTIRR
jgi:hypothetical protein